MITRLTPKPGTTLQKILLCDELFLDGLPNPRLVPLFGPNGIGKSSLIEALIKTLSGEAKELEADVDRQVPARLWFYRDRKDNARIREPRSYREAFDPRYVDAKWNAQHLSEGQSILYSFMDLLDALGKGKHSIPEDGTQHIVVLDELDSGLSIDNLDMVLRKMTRAARLRSDIQIIFAFNNPYVLQYCPTVLSLYGGYATELKNTDEMLEYIRAHAAEFRKLRYYANGRPRLVK